MAGILALTAHRRHTGGAATPPRVLLTGATGFVGFHVADAFASAGFRVRAIARSPDRAVPLQRHGFEVVAGSLEDEDALTAACRDIDVVVHMAALTHARTDAEYEQVNVAGTARLLRVALAADPRPRRFVYLSSLAAVGPCVDGRGVRGDDPARPLTAYGRSKLAGERVVLEAADRIEVVVLRAPGGIRASRYRPVPLLPPGPSRRGAGTDRPGAATPDGPRERSGTGAGPCRRGCKGDRCVPHCRAADVYVGGGRAAGGCGSGSQGPRHEGAGRPDSRAGGGERVGGGRYGAAVRSSIGTRPASCWRRAGCVKRRPRKRISSSRRTSDWRRDCGRPRAGIGTTAGCRSTVGPSPMESG
jgi:NAD(P)-dependent dehydrogenase (short-subunit alcohol dehydrogenase family)